MKIKNKTSVHESEPTASSDFKFSENMSKSEIAALLAELESDERFERETLMADIMEMEDAANEVIKAKEQAITAIKSSKDKIEDAYNKFNDYLKARQLAKAKNSETNVYEM